MDDPRLTQFQVLMNWNEDKALGALMLFAMRVRKAQKTTFKTEDIFLMFGRTGKFTDDERRSLIPNLQKIGFLKLILGARYRVMPALEETLGEFADCVPEGVRPVIIDS